MTSSQEFSLVLDVYKNWMLIVRSSAISPDRLFLLRLPPVGEMADQGIPVTPERHVRCILGITFEIWRFLSPVKDLSGRDVHLSALYIGSRQNENGKFFFFVNYEFTCVFFLKQPSTFWQDRPRAL